MKLTSVVFVLVVVLSGGEGAETDEYSPHCGLRRIDEADLDTVSFRKEFQSTPVIVRTNRTVLGIQSPGDLAKKLGHLTVNADRSKELFIMGRTEMLLRDFVYRNGSWKKGTDYCFHLDPRCDSALHAKALAPLFTMPAFVGHPPDTTPEKYVANGYPDCGVGEVLTHYLLVGQPGAYIAKHSHREGWNALFYGTKKWFLRSPDGEVTHTCVQHAGEIIWLPDWWDHEVRMSEPTFGVAFQIKDEGGASVGLSLLMNGGPVAFIEDLYWQCLDILGMPDLDPRRLVVLLVLLVGLCYCCGWCGCGCGWCDGCCDGEDDESDDEGDGHEKQE